jgi:dolichol-phosphate mannosyltransferase
MYKSVSGESKKVAVVIPAYKVSQQIVGVVESVPSEIDLIIIVDDACPENSGQIIESNFSLKRVIVARHPSNRGVGGAMKTGYRVALENGAEVIVKVDGDGQMNPLLIPNLIKPLLLNSADYSKGNRFYSFKLVQKMPRVRLIGNIVLSFMSKLSTGYYQIFDPNNGFTAISRDALELLDLDSVDERYFFESDMLFQLNCARRDVVDVPMPAIYGTEVSNLKVGHSIFYFLVRHIRNYFKRIVLNYFVRDFSLATIQLLLGTILGFWGAFLGLSSWLHSMSSGLPSQPGTVVLVAILCISSLQLILSFINFDMSLSRRDKS